MPEQLANLVQEMSEEKLRQEGGGGAERPMLSQKEIKGKGEKTGNGNKLDGTEATKNPTVLLKHGVILPVTTLFFLCFTA